MDPARPGPDGLEPLWNPLSSLRANLFQLHSRFAKRSFRHLVVFAVFLVPLSLYPPPRRALAGESAIPVRFPFDFRTSADDGKRLQGRLGMVWGRRGVDLAPSWAVLACLGAVLGSSWAMMRLGAVMGCLGRALGPLRAIIQIRQINLHFDSPGPAECAERLNKLGAMQIFSFIFIYAQRP